MTLLMDFGRAVEVTTENKTKLIPAVNIQVENIPEGYGVYFEIFFENGSLWVIEQDISGNDRGIYVTKHADWAHNEDLNSYSTVMFSTWDDFIDGYVSACV